MSLWKYVLPCIALTVVACGKSAQNPQELGRLVANAHVEGNYGIIEDLLASSLEVESVFGSSAEISVGPKDKMDRTQLVIYRDSPKAWFDFTLKKWRPLGISLGNVEIAAQTDKLAIIAAGLKTKDPDRPNNSVFIIIYAYRVERGWVVIYMI